jgi:hypothetical protein
MDMFKKNNSGHSLIDAFKDQKIHDRLEALEKQDQNPAKKGLKESIEMPQGTVRQIAFALYYLQEAKYIPKITANKSTNAKFISFITGKSSESLRKNLSDPKEVCRHEKSGKATKSIIIDLIKIKSLFEVILFLKGIEMVTNDIEALEKDLKSFNPI